MANILNINEDKNIQNGAVGGPEAANGSALASRLNAKGAEPGEETVIHVMPEKFRSFHSKGSQAKTAGLIVISAGCLFLIAIAVLLYFYLLKPSEKAADQNQPAAVEEIKQPENSVQPDLSESQSGADIGSSTDNFQTSDNDTTESGDNAGAGNDQIPSDINGANEEQAASTSVDFIIGNDSDQDGLTDSEEQLLGSSPALRDSDSDGYSDAAELMNLYNPAGEGALASNPNIKKYYNALYGYNLLYPYNWAQSAITGDDSIIFKAQNDQFIQVIVQPNSEKEEIAAWHQKHFSDSDVNMPKIISGGGWQGVKNENGMIVYLTDNDLNNIYIITYNSGLGKTLDYINIFNLAIKSFTVGRE